MEAAADGMAGVLTEPHQRCCARSNERTRMRRSARRRVEFAILRRARAPARGATFEPLASGPAPRRCYFRARARRRRARWERPTVGRHASTLATRLARAGPSLRRPSLPSCSISLASVPRVCIIKCAAVGSARQAQYVFRAAGCYWAGREHLSSAQLVYLALRSFVAGQLRRA